MNYNIFLTGFSFFTIKENLRNFENTSYINNYGVNDGLSVNAHFKVFKSLTKVSANKNGKSKFGGARSKNEGKVLK